ncbi:MAG: DNA gyrase inhibitor YacG [Pseudomonadota bacterium]
MGDSRETKDVGSRARCPICRKPTVHQFRPFCSSRCRDVDLARWFGGAYAASRPIFDEDDLFTKDRDLS